MNLKKNLLNISFAVCCILSIGALFMESKNNSSQNEDKPEPLQPNVEQVVEKGFGVSTSNTYATQVGMDILNDGGTAVDAAIAVSYALGVLQPDASGIGGGGGMLIYDGNTKEYDFFNYRDSAPISSDIKLSPTGVPGFVKGMEEIHQAYGTMPLEQLIDPAIYYAENGFKLSNDLYSILAPYENYLKSKDLFIENGKLIQVGNTVYQPQLANTLKLIQEQGSDVFYKGEIAQEIAKNSTLTMKDLAAYEIQRREPVVGEYNGYQIVSAPAPFSGVTLIQMLKMFETLDITNPESDPNEYLKQLGVITDLASSSRVSNLTDPTFYSVDEQKLVSDKFINNLLAKEQVAYVDDNEYQSTTHFVIIDADGTMVSCTNTIGDFLGAKNNVAGMFLNGTMENFSSKNSGINKYEAGKMPRNFTAPTIISKDDEMFGIGSPGGNRIIKILAPILLDNLQFGTDLQESINKSRVLFKNTNSLYIEQNDYQPFVDYQDSNYSFIKQTNPSYFGAVQVIGSDGDTLYGAADYRRNGSYLLE